MKRILFLLVLLCLEKVLHAQYIYTIKADSVKITNTCDTAELIIENHTQTVPGFLFNKGRGRTEFRRGLSKVDDSIYVIGIDTLKLSVAWLQGGNRFGTTGKFGTLDNNHIDFYTNNTKRGRWTNAGNLLISTETDNGYNLAVEGTTYSKFLTNSPTPLGGREDGAIRLRWGGWAGDYIGFYYQGNNNRRGGIGSPSDTRPMWITDEVGISFLNTPFVSVGPSDCNNCRMIASSYRSSGWNELKVQGRINDTIVESDLTVTAVGNTMLGGETDNGYKLQVNGRSWFGNDLYFSSPTYATGGMGAGMQWVGNNMFQIYGGPSHESLTFGPENQIHSSVGIQAPWFYGTSPVGADANYYVPMDGGVYSTPGAGSNATKVYHKFTNTPAQINSSNGNPTLMEINKMVNRGDQDGLETGLRILFSINGTANNLRALETVNGNVKLNTTNGKTSIGLDPDSGITSKLDVTGDNGYNQFRLRKKYTPTSSSDTNGSVGDMSWDDNYIYIKTAEGWKRSALTSF